MSSERDERDRLRRRVYGPGAEPVSTEDIDRLRTLERREPSVPAGDRPAPSDPPTTDPADVAEPEPRSTAARPAARSSRRILLWAAGAVSIAGLGFGAGAVATAPTPFEMVPEFRTAATTEDLLPDDAFAVFDDLDPDTVRFIADLGDRDVFLAATEGWPGTGGVCHVIVPHSGDGASGGCVSGFGPIVILGERNGFTDRPAPDDLRLSSSVYYRPDDY